MFRLAIFTAMLLSGAIATTVANAQTTPENAKQSSDDSDLFALPKTPKRDIKANIAAAKKEADAARTSRIAAEKRADAAEKRADAAQEAAEILTKLANPQDNDSDLFALPKTPRRDIKADIAAAKKEADAVKKEAEAAKAIADLTEDLSND